jgi:NADPH:quinone reductase-like Zn-dependent oxidoreductase
VSATMRAIRLDRFGGPEVLLPAELPRPAPGPTEVLVRVHAAGVNPVDWKTRAGRGMARVLGDPPLVPGWDVAGVVAAVGFGVTRFAPGDRVFGMPHFPRRAGAYAEYVTAPSRQFAQVPAGLDDVAAAALPLAGLTAWQALVDTAGVRAGQTVLVHAAAGGVGHLAVQIARARGARVVATARAARHELLRELGAQETIDYAAGPFEAELRGVDVVLDLVGGEYGPRSLATLRPGGLLIAVPGGVDAELAAAAARLGRRVTGILVEPDGAGLAALADLVTAGGLRVLVQQTFPLAQAAAAHRAGEAGHLTGKLVLTTTR